MPRTAMSNRERKALKGKVLAAPRYAKPEAGKVVARKAAPAGKAGPLKREGLEWLFKKGRLTPPRLRAALFYQRRFADNDGVSLKSCIDPTSTGGAPGPGMYFDIGVVTVTQAKRELFVIRHQILAGQYDMLTALDGVCGVGHTLRELGKTQARAIALEQALMCALDLIARWLDTRDAVRDLQTNSKQGTNTSPHEIRVASDLSRETV